IIIGIFNFIRILTFKEFSTDKFTINNQSIFPTKRIKIFAAFFFLFHYGMFNFGYFIFVLVNPFSINTILNAKNSSRSVFTTTVAIGIAIFFINHAFSFFYNRKADDKRRPNIGRLIFFPYVRILPMHITIFLIILLGAFVGGIVESSGTLLLFLILKMIADVLSHIFEHAGVEDKKEEK
ncbi:MAG: DUF6498-containing protein, partial [bacterium]